MDTGEIITLVIAIYGSTIATILAIREIRRDRRKISIFLEYVAFYERAQLVITNIGFRPITITEIGMAVGIIQNGDTIWDQVPRNSLLGREVGDEIFPATLGDGENLTIPLSDPVSHSLFENQMKAQVSVYDVEGNVYTEYKIRLYNPKWGQYDKMD